MTTVARAAQIAAMRVTLGREVEARTPTESFGSRQIVGVRSPFSWRRPLSHSIRPTLILRLKQTSRPFRSVDPIPRDHRCQTWMSMLLLVTTMPGGREWGPNPLDHRSVKTWFSR